MESLDRVTADLWIAEQRKAYEAAGFEVRTDKKYKHEPFIEVKAVEAKIDPDFYDYT